MIGTKLAHYEITGHLGTGGMGEVYQATDSKLGRSVAIKLLPEAFSRDKDRLSRFEREARVLASLNHPNIAAIHGLEESGGRKFLVMELVPGETLAERIARGPIPVEEAITLSRQIAAALESAHEKGVIHRDLKPANIKITPNGQVKVLDFGLAKAFAGESAQASLSNSPTMTAAATSAGVILGTAAYMSPEQAKGQQVDQRTDIFAFGCVLYEMLTAKQSFAGEGVSEILASVLKSEPDWDRLPQNTPASVRHLLRRCLRKDKTRRLQAIGDARIEIEEAHTEPEQAGPIAAAAGLRRREMLAWIAAGAGATAAATLAVIRFGGASVQPETGTAAVPSFNIYAPEKAIFSGTIGTTVTVPMFALSPDGRSIVFAAGAPGVAPKLWLRSFEDLSERPLTGTENGEYPFWSPDGRWIGFFADGRVKKVSPVDGQVRTVADTTVEDTRGGSWGPDGTILFGTGYDTVYKIPPDGVAVAMGRLDDSRKEGSHRWPAFLPDGKHFLFTVRAGIAEQNGVYAGSLDGNTKKLIVRSEVNAFYASDFLIFQDVDGNAKAQTFDAARLERRNQPFDIPARIGRASNGYLAISASRSGMLAYSSALLTQGQLTWFDRSGKPTGMVGPVGDHSDFSLSHDWKKLASSLVDPKTRSIDFSVTELGQSSPPAPDRTQQLTFGRAVNASPVWSPDDGYIAFRTTRTGGFVEIYKKSSAGGGEEEAVLLKDTTLAAGGASLIVPTSWTSAGLLYTDTGSTASSVWRLPMGGAGKPVPIIQTKNAQLMHAYPSPNGSLLAYTQYQFGRFEVWAQTLPKSAFVRQISIDGGYEPRWSADGSELYFLSGDRRLMVVKVAPNLWFDIPKKLFQTQVPAEIRVSRTHYVPNQDGSRFLVNTQIGDPVPTPITIMLNWVQGLKK